jgi:hypothetical protein
MDSNNKNYFKYPAQTNLELYEQMLDANFSHEDILTVNKAYLFTIDKVYTLFRGSGKPFICHLVGTSSLLIAAGQPLELVVAGLMHALYQNRVPFENFLEIEERRIRVTAKFGNKIEKLIFDYTNFEDTDLKDVLISDPNLNRDIVILHLADSIEDLLGYSIFLHGNEDDNESVKGSFLWNKEKYNNQHTALINIANNLGVKEWIESINYWMDFERYRKLPVKLKTGFNTSVNFARSI